MTIESEYAITSRPYKSRTQRPCDFCRKRKSCCIIDGSIPCKLCRQFNKSQCTFNEGPISRTRKKSMSPNTKSFSDSTDPKIGKIKVKKIKNKTKSNSISISSLDVPEINELNKKSISTNRFIEQDQVKSPKSTPLIPYNLHSQIPNLNLKDEIELHLNEYETNTNQTLINILHKSDLDIEASFKTSRNKKYSVSSSSSTSSSSISTFYNDDFSTNLSSYQQAGLTFADEFTIGLGNVGGVKCAADAGSSYPSASKINEILNKDIEFVEILDDFHNYNISHNSNELNVSKLIKEYNNSKFDNFPPEKSLELIKFEKRLAEYHRGIFEKKYQMITNHFIVTKSNEVVEVSTIGQYGDLIGYVIKLKTFKEYPKKHMKDFYCKFNLQLIFKLIKFFIEKINITFPILSTQQINIFNEINDNLKFFNNSEYIIDKFNDFFPVELISIISIISINNYINVDEILIQSEFNNLKEIEGFLLSIINKIINSQFTTNYGGNYNYYNRLQTFLLMIYNQITSPISSNYSQFNNYHQIILMINQSVIVSKLMGLQYNCNDWNFTNDEVKMDEWEKSWRLKLWMLVIIMDKWISLNFDTECLIDEDDKLEITGNEENDDFKELFELSLLLGNYMKIQKLTKFNLSYININELYDKLMINLNKTNDILKNTLIFKLMMFKITTNELREKIQLKDTAEIHDKLNDMKFLLQKMNDKIFTNYNLINNPDKLDNHFHNGLIKFLSYYLKFHWEIFYKDLSLLNKKNGDTVMEELSAFLKDFANDYLSV